MTSASLTSPPSRRGRGPLLISAAAFSLGGVAVYLAVMPALLQASLAYELLFAAAGIAQVGLAVGLLVTADGGGSNGRRGRPSWPGSPGRPGWR